MKIEEMNDEQLQAAKLRLENQRDELKPRIMEIQQVLDLRAAAASLKRKLAEMSPAERLLLVNGAFQAGEKAAEETAG